MPNPVLCIERLVSCLHEFPTGASTLPNFILHIMPHVSTSLYPRVSWDRYQHFSAPKLKELLVVRGPRTANIPSGDFNASASFLFSLLGHTTLDEWAPTLSRLQVAQFHEINWKHEHLSAFKQLRASILQDCNVKQSSSQAPPN